MSTTSEQFITELFAKGNIQINGTRPQDFQVHDKRVFERILSHGSLGLGESYMDGWWDADRVDEFFFHMLRNDLYKAAKSDFAVMWRYLKGRLINVQRMRAFEVGEKHYDISNELYETMLDKRLTYSCGYWKEAKTLDEAQEAKLDLICKKVGLQKDQHILDIGSGWGSFLKFAAEKYGIQGTGVTVSKNQSDYFNAHRGGLPIESTLTDWREITGTYDHVVSVGMFEHVGYKNYRALLEKVYDILNDDGYFLLHTIGSMSTRTSGDPWSDKYIFPNGMLPSVTQLGQATEGMFVIEDWHNFGADYDKTLLEWCNNFDAGWDNLKETYDERFYRMWKYYLLSFAGSFRARHIQLWQIVLSKKGTVGGYSSVR